jgi:hypothetical protein
MVRDMARYYRLDPALRAQKLAEWNRPTWWPPLALVALVAAVAWRARVTLRRRERMNARGEVLA